MPDLAPLTKIQRINAANAVLAAVAQFGRRFFFDHHSGRVARFELALNGKLWLRDEHTNRRVYVSYRGKWRWFSNGGTMQRLVEDLGSYIKRGSPISSRHFGPWPQHLCNGDLWGYGPEAMTALRAALAGSPAIAQHRAQEGRPDA